MQTIKHSSRTLTSEAAKNLVFDHWDFLTKLARKRFPGNYDLGDQALSYVLDKLEEHEWERVRGWDGCGNFATFVAVLASRMMTDFVRSRFGYHRPPVWLQDKKDLVWQKAYKLYAVDKYERREAVEILQSNTPEMNRDAIEDVVNTVYSKCTRQARFSEGNISIDQVLESTSTDNTMPDNLDMNNKQLIEALIEYIQSGGDTLEAVEDELVKNLLNHLRSHVKMSDEDRLLLRLRYCEGLKVKEISQMLHLEGNTYKRINGLIDELRNAFQRSGLVAA